MLRCPFFLYLYLMKAANIFLWIWMAVILLLYVARIYTWWGFLLIALLLAVQTVNLFRNFEK